MNAIVKGSIAAIAQQTGASLAETFVNVDALVIIDTSGSMAAVDSTAGRSRYEQACTELASLQANLPGKIGVIAFSDEVMFCPTGQPHFFSSGTDMAAALRFAKIADVSGMRFILISDGQPDNPAEALAVARTYKNRIDVIFIGNELNPTGRDFLEELARISGGVSVSANRTQGLCATAERLLETK